MGMGSVVQSGVWQSGKGSVVQSGVWQSGKGRVVEEKRGGGGRYETWVGGQCETWVEGDDMKHGWRGTI